MTNEYVLIQDKDLGLGQIAVARSVVDHIVSITVHEDKNIFLAHKKAVRIEENKNVLSVFLEVRVQYGQDVEKVCHQLQDRLQTSLELMIDKKNAEVNIAVVGFKFN
ncbi:Asp23/Gls24 family envelope stress response protein [Erysipelothrix urinaevulpis]|uniref:Asp23/Gls24 family envelope stress response protein n=1 Tax=Erysipelothrix urinaevulpis TaxID=2683717 RepID=UPI00135A68C9|nr:Asp23/Gls24 family envelope stress response protein [Erysipelothrix urinaevulpis]